MPFTLKNISLSIFSLALIFITLIAYFKRTVVSGGVYGASDFYKFYESVLFYFSGQNIYSNVIVELKNLETQTSTWVSANGNLNPPFFTFLLLPLHVFNYAKAYEVFNFFSTLCIFLGGYLALQPFPEWRKKILLILALFLLYLPNSENLAYGQIASFLLVLLSAAWLFARENKDISAGLCIGLACAIKLFCGLFLIYFFCIKKYRIILSALGMMVLTSLLGLWVFGLQSYVEYHTILNNIGWYAASWNVSFYGFFVKLFSNAEKNIPLFLAPQLVNILTVIFSGGLIIYLIGLWRKWGVEQLDMGFAGVIVAMLLLSPLGWLYYFPLLLIPYLVLVARGNDYVHLGLCGLLFLSCLTGNFIRPMQMLNTTQIFIQGGFGFYILLGLLVLLGVVGQKMVYKTNQKTEISIKLWVLIYGLIFIPSLISLGAIFRDLP